jgi:hypothetical protein
LDFRPVGDGQAQFEQDNFDWRLVGEGLAYFVQDYWSERSACAALGCSQKQRFFLLFFSFLLVLPLLFKMTEGVAVGFPNFAKFEELEELEEIEELEELVV